MLYRFTCGKQLKASVRAVRSVFCHGSTERHFAERMKLRLFTVIASLVQLQRCSADTTRLFIAADLVRIPLQRLYHCISQQLQLCLGESYGLCCRRFGGTTCLQVPFALHACYMVPVRYPYSSPLSIAFCCVLLGTMYKVCCISSRRQQLWGRYRGSQ